MKPVAIFVVVAAFAALSVAVQAETVNANQARNADDKSVAAVAGPPAAATTADKRDDRKNTATNEKDTMKPDQVTPAKPVHTDPN